MSIRIRRATADDVPAIVDWRRQAAAWLAAQGSDQWSDAGLSRTAFTDRVHASITRGETWIAELDGRPVGTIAVDDHADPGLWTPDELRESVIVHRMITAPGVRGARTGVGEALLDQADAVARDRVRTWVRLDAWTTNTRLHDYYRGRGFRLVRVADPTRPSSALFERPVPVAPRRPVTVHVEDPTAPAVKDTR
ncbi:GNAT family N-acetyltransferase [Saccharothrix sp. HUAS TT1]|uniref:GNAT family N-acetyltransferase n=1 Tax=unclassified Saccharothrix TaxID=2593673 RepID=UPI00345C22C5